MKKLVFAELVDGSTDHMKNDPKVHILSDGGLFLITTPEHAPTYSELMFFEVDEESRRLYKLERLLNTP